MWMAVAVIPSVAILAAASLKGLGMVLAHKAKRAEHAPLADLQRKLDELEQRLLSGAMRR